MNASPDWFKISSYHQSAPINISYRDVALQPARDSSVRLLTTREAKQQQGWVKAVTDQLAALLNLPENWNSYGAKAPRIASAVELTEVLNAVMKPDTPGPSIVPTSFGHFQAEWHVNGIDLEVEVVGPTTIEVTYSSLRNPAWEETLSGDLTQLVKAVGDLTNP